MDELKTLALKVPRSTHQALRYISVRTGRTMLDIATEAIDTAIKEWVDPATGEGVPPFVTAGES